MTGDTTEEQAGTSGKNYGEPCFVSPSGGSLADQKKRVTPEQRWRMIEEAAYYRAEKRGFLGDQLAADWTAAEAEIDEQYEIDLAQTMRESDASKLLKQLRKAFSGPRFGGVNFGELLRLHSKNLEALALANKQALESTQLVLTHQAEVFRHIMQSAADSVKVLTHNAGTADVIQKQEAILQIAREKALDEMRQIAEIIAENQKKTLKTIRQRMQDEIARIAARLATTPALPKSGPDSAQLYPRRLK